MRAALFEPSMPPVFVNPCYLAVLSVHGGGLRPLDEALPWAVVDVSSRPLCLVDLGLKQELLGQLPCEMVRCPAAILCRLISFYEDPLTLRAGVCVLGRGSRYLMSLRASRPAPGSPSTHGLAPSLQRPPLGSKHAATTKAREAAASDMCENTCQTATRQS